MNEPTCTHDTCCCECCGPGCGCDCAQPTRERPQVSTELHTGIDLSKPWFIVPATDCE